MSQRHLWVGLVALAACAASPATPTTATAPSAPPAPATDATPARTLYQRGKVYQPIGADGDRYTCDGDAQLEADCKLVRPGHACTLESPVGYWEGSIRCKGTRITDEEQQRDWERLSALTVPRCVCSCADDFIAAADAWERRREHCSRVP
jgi:hypothetical protein